MPSKQARRTGMAFEAILVTQALNLGPPWWNFVSQVATLANFYLTTWEEYHTGKFTILMVKRLIRAPSAGSLYLGVFSGPVEGILMIIGIYMTLWYVPGLSFWDTGILDFLSHVYHIADMIPDIGLGGTFMVFGAFGLAFNVFSSYANVRTAMSFQQIHDATTFPPPAFRVLGHPQIDDTVPFVKLHSPSFLSSSNLLFLYWVHNLAIPAVRTLPLCVGTTIRAPGWEDDSGACYQRSISDVGFQMVAECSRRIRREFTEAY
ncbi:hypothetical protein BT96DRAFT_988586 [Gymnopus androsaceus JB14]|uniref:Uncharacterized protein n=1 Tax=Gymnopus androsaceus JB14 TaxID=1447944 RepID=A0A6A4I9D8_9AGAR|nr:hypothetical protein BT96DRAFT_988586 [Gymnopus androsaceus JB14]